MQKGLKMPFCRKHVQEHRKASSEGHPHAELLCSSRRNNDIKSACKLLGVTKNSRECSVSHRGFGTVNKTVLLPDAPVGCVFGTHASSKTLETHKIHEIMLLRDLGISKAVRVSQPSPTGAEGGSDRIPDGSEELSNIRESRDSARTYINYWIAWLKEKLSSVPVLIFIRTFICILSTQRFSSSGFMFHVHTNHPQDFMSFRSFAGDSLLLWELFRVLHWPLVVSHCQQKFSSPAQHHVKGMFTEDKGNKRILKENTVV